MRTILLNKNYSTFSSFTFFHFALKNIRIRDGDTDTDDHFMTYWDLNSVVRSLCLQIQALSTCVCQDVTIDDHKSYLSIFLSSKIGRKSIWI